MYSCKRYTNSVYLALLRYNCIAPWLQKNFVVGTLPDKSGHFQKLPLQCPYVYLLIRWQSFKCRSSTCKYCQKFSIQGTCIGKRKVFHSLKIVLINSLLDRECRPFRPHVSAWVQTRLKYLNLGQFTPNLFRRLGSQTANETLPILLVWEVLIWACEWDKDRHDSFRFQTEDSVLV